MLYENITIKRTRYFSQHKIPYCIERDLRKRWLPSYKVNTYILTKAWNSDLVKAEKLFRLMKSLKKYDKVKLHKGCVYATYRVN